MGRVSKLNGMLRFKSMGKQRSPNNHHVKEFVAKIDRYISFNVILHYVIKSAKLSSEIKQSVDVDNHSPTLSVRINTLPSNKYHTIWRRMHQYENDIHLYVSTHTKQLTDSTEARIFMCLVYLCTGGLVVSCTHTCCVLQSIP